ncbi:MAG: ISL3 family transposase [Actinomycetota bacterium]|nr:ISL3 family transposase [Actinomycetota bacterium]
MACPAEAKTPIAGMLGIGWDTVGRIVERVMADRLDERRLAGLVAVGVDEISYRRGQRYLTSFVDHRTGAIVWCAAGRNAQTLQAFFDEIGDRKHSIRAVSIDMSGGYEKAIRDNAAQAEICFDPFHVVRLAQRAVDQVRRDEWNAHERSHTPKGRWIKGTRWSLLKAPARQSIGQLALLSEVQQANKSMYRAFLLKEELRLLDQLDDPRLTPAHLDGWLAWASRSRLLPFIKLARTIRRHRAGILAAIRLGLSNRAPGGPQQPHPPDQPPQLRLPLSRTPHRPRLPLLQRDPHRPPAMNLTPNTTGAPRSRTCRMRRCRTGVCSSPPPDGPTGARAPAHFVAASFLSGRAEHGSDVLAVVALVAVAASFLVRVGAAAAG